MDERKSNRDEMLQECVTIFIDKTSYLGFHSG